MRTMTMRLCTLILSCTSLLACQDRPEIVRFAATPSVIPAGLATELSWETRGAETVEISPDVGAVSLSGSLVISPNGSTTYVLTARSGGDEDSRSLDVTKEAPGDGGLSAETKDITVRLEGDGMGRVASDPPVIDCGARCTAQVPREQEVHLTATAKDGSVFVQWKGACEGSGADCSLTGLASQSVSAVFALASGVHTLTVNLAGPGQVKGTVGTSFSCLSPPNNHCTAFFGHGASLTFTPVGLDTVALASVFSQWAGCDKLDGPDCIVVMNKDRSVTASFKKCMNDSTCQETCMKECLDSKHPYATCVKSCAETCRTCP